MTQGDNDPLNPPFITFNSILATRKAEGVGITPVRRAALLTKWGRDLPGRPLSFFGPAAHPIVSSAFARYA